MVRPSDSRRGFQGLALLGWIVGRNLQVETRWATTDPAEIRRHTTELAALAPDVHSWLGKRMTSTSVIRLFIARSMILIPRAIASSSETVC
jgi:ABC-type antimicrobial peptide transport system ATPase subunit